MNVDGLLKSRNELLGHNIYNYCGNNPINCKDPDGNCWHKLWITDCDKCVRKKKNTISFTGIFNAAVDVAVAHSGGFRTARNIGNTLKMGNGYSSPGVKGAVSIVSKYEVSIGQPYLGAQAGIGRTISLNRGDRGYAYIGVNGNGINFSGDIGILHGMNYYWMWAIK